MSFIDELFHVLEEKEDPNAKVRNKTNPVFDNNSKLVNDNKDHFPLTNLKQARNALARANQFDKVPAWFNGSLKELKIKVANAVKKAYPSIEVTEKAID